jgi:hypothetical protein
MTYWGSGSIASRIIKLGSRWIWAVSFKLQPLYLRCILWISYGLDDRGSWVRFPAGAWNFSLHHRVEIGSGAHPAFYSMGIRVSFPGVKRPGREPDHSHLVPRSKNAWRYTSTPQYAFMEWCSLKKSTGTTLPLLYNYDDHDNLHIVNSLQAYTWKFWCVYVWRGRRVANDFLWFCLPHCPSHLPVVPML